MGLFFLRQGILLGLLVLMVAENFDGIIDFGGALLPPLTPAMRKTFFEGISWDEISPLCLPPLSAEPIGAVPGHDALSEGSIRSSCDAAPRAQG